MRTDYLDVVQLHVTPDRKVLEENASKVAEAFKQVLSSQQVIVSKIDFQGARLTR
jgi:predicted oxidoreductase